TPRAIIVEATTLRGVRVADRSCGGRPRLSTPTEIRDLEIATCRKSLCSVRVIVKVVIVARLARGVLALARVDRLGHEQAALGQDRLERGEKAVVVAIRFTGARSVLPRGDLLDQARAKVVPREGTARCELVRDAEHASLPGRIEDELAV